MAGTNRTGTSRTTVVGESSKVDGDNAALHIERAQMLIIALVDDLESNAEDLGWIGERLKLLAKTAVRHLDVANGAIGSRHAGNYAEEFAALGGKP